MGRFERNKEFHLRHVPIRRQYDSSFHSNRPQRREVTAFAPFTPPAGGLTEGKIVSMVYLVVNIIELSNETLHTIVDDHSGDRMMLYRSRIEYYLDQISHTCHFGLGAAVVPMAMNLVECGAVGRDQGRFR